MPEAETVAETSSDESSDSSSDEVESSESLDAAAFLQVRACDRCSGLKSMVANLTYKHVMLISYASRVVITSKLLILTTLES